MESFGRWRALHLKQESLPALFACHEFAASRYGVILTDLTNVWEERLDINEICDRAECDGCTINPRDDRQQLEVFFRKIADTLDDLETTSMTLGTNNNERQLILRISAPLPAPLPEFTWEIKLEKKDGRALTCNVLCPLLLNLHQKQQTIEQLHRQLQDKDHVIAKLLDKMESSTTDLKEVFPGTSGVRTRKGMSQRTQLAKHVNGLAPFDKMSLQAETGSVPATESLLDVAETAHGSQLQDLWRKLGEHPQHWWSTIGRPSSSGSKPLEALSSRQSSGQDDDTAGETEDEAEFRVQESPRRSDPEPISAQTADEPLRSSSIVSREMSVVDVMRSSPPMPDLERYTPPSLPPSEMNTPKRLGHIGRYKEKAVSQPRATSPPVVPRESENIKGNTQTTPSKARFSQRLGVIGGRKTQSQMSQPLDPIPSIETADERDETSVQANHSQSEAAQSTDLPKISTPARGRAAQSKDPISEPPVAPRETSQERADRRREELKHQLAVQIGGGPKKKRKF